MDLIRQRLASQAIGRGTYRQPEEALRHLTAVQSQDYAGAKWTLGIRCTGVSDAEVDAAFDEGRILRTHLLRPTWHFVCPDDIGWLLALTAPRVQAQNATYYRKLELDPAALARSDRVIVEALEARGPLPRDEIRAALEAAGIVTTGSLRMGYILMHAELDGLICSGPRMGKQHSYALLDQRAPLRRQLDRDQGLAELAARYFAARGPATVHDMAKWSGLTLSDCRRGLEAAKHGLVQEQHEGAAYWWPEGVAAEAEPSPTAHLLSIYDEYLSSYKGWSAVVDDANSRRLVAMGNLLNHVVLLDGRVVGAWRRVVGREGVTAELLPGWAPEPRQLRVLEAAAQRYGRFLGVPVVLG